MPVRYMSGSSATPSRIASTAARNAARGVRRSWEIEDSISERSYSIESSRATMTSNISAASPSSSLRTTPVRAVRSPSATRIAASQMRLASRATGRAISIATIAAPITAGISTHISRPRSWSLMNIACAETAIIKMATPSTARVAAMNRRASRFMACGRWEYVRCSARRRVVSFMARSGSRRPTPW